MSNFSNPQCMKGTIIPCNHQAKGLLNSAHLVNCDSLDLVTYVMMILPADWNDPNCGVGKGSR